MENAIKSRINYITKENGIESCDKKSITELILDGSRFKNITVEEGKLLKEFNNLTKMSLNGTGINSLENFPEIPTLQVLELTDNYLSDPLIFTLIPRLFPNLKTLQLGGNYFKSIEDVKPLASMQNLKVLGLAMNPLASSPNYRDKVFNYLHGIQVLDHNDRTGAERLIESDSENDDDLSSEEGDDLLKKFYDAEYKTDDEDDEFVPDANQSEDEEIISEDSIDENEDDDEDYSESNVRDKRLRDEDDDEGGGV